MKLIGSSLILILFAAAASASPVPVEQALTEELAAMYDLDTSQYVIEVDINRLKTESVEPGDLSLRPLVQKAPLGLFTVAATIERDGRTVESAQVRLRISRFADVLVAADRIGLRDDLTRENLTVRRMDITKMYEKPITSYQEVEGFRAKRNIRKGTVLTTSAVEVPPDVESGREVTIVYTDGRCRITTPGRALQTGSSGEYIKVKNTGSGKIIMARVVDDGSVAVDP